MSKNVAVDKNNNHLAFNVPKISIHPIEKRSVGSAFEGHFTLSRTQNENFEKENLKKKQQINLPIITHTCPTPIHTPTTSTRNSMSFINRKLFYDPKYVDLRNGRKFSLDSSKDRALALVKEFF